VTWYRYDAAGATLRLNLQVQPNARRSEFAGVHGERLKVRIAAPAVDDKANQLLLDFIADRFQLPRSKVMITQGERSRAKIVQISGVGPDVLATISHLNDD
jgi:uncharacterized protein (TIGR00251 family)